MTWTDVPQVLPKSVRAPVSMRVSGFGSAGAIHLHLTVADLVFANLGWNAGDSVCLAEGAGPHAGLLRFMAGPGRRLRALPRSGWLTVAMGPPSSLANLICPASACEYRIDGGALIVTIPWELPAATDAPAIDPADLEDPAPAAATARLSPAEQDAVDMLATGSTPRQVAADTGLSLARVHDLKARLEAA
jgi:DNA-binding CsgD family transcriptional regulator